MRWVCQVHKSRGCKPPGWSSNVPQNNVNHCGTLDSIDWGALGRNFRMSWDVRPDRWVHPPNQNVSWTSQLIRRRSRHGFALERIDAFVASERSGEDRIRRAMETLIALHPPLSPPFRSSARSVTWSSRSIFAARPYQLCSNKWIIFPFLPVQ